MLNKWTMNDVLWTFYNFSVHSTSSKLFLLLCLMLTISSKRPPPTGILEDSSMTEIITATGQRVVLPCSVTPPEPDDRPIMVLIYQGDNRTPAYSLDARGGGSLDNGEPWSDKDSLGTRAKFVLSITSPSGLVIHPVRGRDRGNYRCRIDFQSSPTRNSRIELRVIVPPRKMIIVTENGIESEDMVGPKVEGQSFTLHCKVIGGHPRPSISWWKEKILLDDQTEVTEQDFVVNTLFIPALKREDLYKNFSCRASNSNITAVLSKSVQLDMIFPIQKVEISGSKTPIDERTARKLICRAYGSRPKATISWFKNGEEIPIAFEKELESGRIFKSSVIIIPTMKDNRAHIVCRASNPELETSVMEDTKTLQVFFAPQLHLVPGKAVDLNNVKDGDDLYFECEIIANPRAYKISWFYEGKPFLQDLGEGVIHSNQSLVLQKIKKERTGTYSCSAENDIGNGTSADIHLRVKYAPLCPHFEPILYGAEKNEKVSVSCQAEGFPKPYSFTWAFNSSSELVDVSEIKEEHKRIIEYVPKEDINFGTLLCWAKNKVARQKVPCLYHIIHSSLPEPVSHCVLNLSSSSVTIDCDEGWNGGIAQTFTLQLSTRNKKFSKTTSEVDYSPRGKGDPRALANTSVAPKPSFVLNGLKPGIHYLVRIAAVNKKGRSSTKSYSFVIPDDAPERQVSQEASGLALNWMFILCVLTGVVVAAFTLVTTVYCVRVKFVSNRRQSVTSEVASERRNSCNHRDKEELMECLTTTSQGVDGIHVKDQIL